MTREKFYASLSPKERKFWKRMADKFGKLKHEGEKAQEGYEVKDYQPHRSNK
jgi:hypothetical protein